LHFQGIGDALGPDPYTHTPTNMPLHIQAIRDALGPDPHTHTPTNVPLHIQAIGDALGPELGGDPELLETAQAALNHVRYIHLQSFKRCMSESVHAHVLSAPCQHQVGERDTEMEADGETGDEWQRGRGREGGRKVGVRVLGAASKIKCVKQRRGRGEGGGKGAPTSDMQAWHTAGRTSVCA